MSYGVVIAIPLSRSSSCLLRTGRRPRGRRPFVPSTAWPGAWPACWHYALLARCRGASLGSSPAVASRRSSSAWGPSLLTFLGTITSTVTSRSPYVPSDRRTPLPRTRKVRPLGVPAGILTVTGAPLCEGTLMSAPSAASGTVTGTVTVRLPPERPKTGCGLTCTRTYRSPAGPPRLPGAPLPRRLIRCPSATPAGIRAWMVRVLAAWPLPLHEVHGSSTTSPRPRQVLHGSEKAKLPRFRLDCPVPSQVGQTLGTVPALAPVPWQTGQGPSPVSLSGTVVPSTASPNDSVVSVSTSAPRRGRAWVPARPPPPNIPPRMSPRPPLPALPPAVPPPPPNRSPRSKPKPPPG